MRTILCISIFSAAVTAFAQSPTPSQPGQSFAKPLAGVQIAAVSPPPPAPTDISKKLYAAIKNENFSVAEILLQQGGDINCRNCEFGGPVILGYRVESSPGPAKMLVWLVEHGANVNTPDDKGVTVFLNAQTNAWNTKWSSPRDIFYMLDHGADVALRDNGGYGVLHYLTRTVPASNQWGGWTPADLASFQASVLSIMNALLDRKADINVAGQDGYTPLMNLASRCNADVVRAFLAAGADPTMKNKVGKRAIDIAVDQAVSGNDKACNAVLDVLKPAAAVGR